LWVITKNHYRVDVLYIVAMGIFTTGDFGFQARKTYQQKEVSAFRRWKGIIGLDIQPQGLVLRKNVPQQQEETGVGSWLKN